MELDAVLFEPEGEPDVGGVDECFLAVALIRSVNPVVSLMVCEVQRRTSSRGASDGRAAVSADTSEWQRC